MSSESPSENSGKLPDGDLLLAGAIAGVVGRTISAPVDRVRILYQVNPERQFTLRRAIKTANRIITVTGVTGLWEGNTAAVLRVVPYLSILFTTYEHYERLIMKTRRKDKDFVSSLAAGAAAGTTATLLTYPLDVLRVRMAAHWTRVPRYPNYRVALKDIIKNEGGIRALFQGLAPTLMGVVPYTGLSFATFHTMKSQIKSRYGYEKDRDIPMYLRFVAGGVAGTIPPLLSYPFSVVKRRMQLGGQRYSSTYDAFRQIYIKEGIRGGLFKGVSITYVKSPLVVALTYSVNDMVLNHIRKIRGIEEFQYHWDVPDDTPPVLHKDHDTTQLSVVESLAAGAVAGACAKTAIAPGDRIKILYQVNPDRPFSLTCAFRTGKTIVSNSGIRGLWRGNGATMLRVIPYSATTYMTFDRYEKLISKLLDQKSNMFTRFLAGASAGGTATLLTYPLDLLRARMAAHWNNQPRYSKYSTAFLEIIKTEGAPALFHGLCPTLLGILPYAGLSFMTFHTLKARLKQWLGIQKDSDIPVPMRLAAGATAGLVAQSATYPLDIVRRRMQVHGKVYTSVWHAFLTIYRNEGLVGGLYKGLSMNWIKGPIAVTISFTVNDLLKNQMRHYHEIKT